MANIINQIKVNNELYDIMDKTANAKLEGIAEGAEVNVIETIQLNSKKLTATDKTVNIVAIEGVATDEEVIILGDDKKISTNLSIAYDSKAKEIKLMSGETQIGTPIDATNFIKDGMVKDAELVAGEGDDEGKMFIEITFNSDAESDPIRIDVSSLIDAGAIADLEERVKANEDAIDAIETAIGKWSENIPDDTTVKGVIEELGAIVENNLIPAAFRQNAILAGYVNEEGETTTVKTDITALQTKINEISMLKPRLTQWGKDSNLNTLLDTGEYEIYGRRMQGWQDNMPIIRGGELHARLTVFNNNNYISQFIRFDNIDGGDCNLYTRVAINGAWENWQKIQGVNEVNLIGMGLNENGWFDTGKTYDDFTESGMYTGVYGYKDVYDAFYETFVLIVINDNLYDTGISQLKYSLYPSKTKSTAVNIQKRFGVKNNKGYYPYNGGVDNSPQNVDKIPEKKLEGFDYVYLTSTGELYKWIDEPFITWLGWKNIIDDSIYNVEKNLEITNEELNKITDKDLIEGVITDGTNIFKDLCSLPSTINNGIQDLPNGTFFKLKAFNNIKQLEFINNNGNISISDNYKKYFQRGEIICTSILDTTTIYIYEIQRQGTLVDGAIQWDKWVLTNNSATNA